MSFKDGKNFIITVNVDGEEKTLYREAEDKKTVTKNVLDELTLGASEYPESVSVLSVEEL
jgi:hypothetical protein